MPAVSRGNGTDTVWSRTGTGRGCGHPLITATDECSPNVFVNGIGVVRIGDRVAPHPFAGCGPDNSTLTMASTTVFANGRGIARIGDEYTADNVIVSGSYNVFAG